MREWYNNPGGMFPGNVASQWGGYRWQTGAGFPIAVFPDPVSGAAANLQLLTSPLYIGNSLRDVIRQWSGTSGDNLNNYLNYVTDATGLSRSTTLTNDNALQIMQAMSGYEGGSRQVSPEQWQQAAGLVLGNEPQSSGLPPSPLLASIYPTQILPHGELPPPDLPGLLLPPETSPFGQSVIGPSQLPNEAWPNVSIQPESQSLQFGPSQVQPDIGLGGSTRDFQPFLTQDQLYSPIASTGLPNFGGNQSLGQSLNTDLGGLYGDSQLQYPAPVLSPDFSRNYQTDSQTGLADFGSGMTDSGNGNDLPIPPSGFDTSIDWGQGLPSGEGITNVQYLVNPETGATDKYSVDEFGAWHWEGSSPSSESPAQEPNDATFQFADIQDPFLLPSGTPVGPLTDTGFGDVVPNGTPVGPLTDRNLGTIISPFGPTQPTPYSGFSGFAPYYGGSLFGSGGSITGSGHDAGGGTFTNFSLGRGFGGPNSFLSMLLPGGGAGRPSGEFGWA